MKAIAQELKYDLHLWSVVNRLIDAQNQKAKSANDPLEMLIAISDLKEKSIVLLKDFHMFLADPNPILIRQLKDVLQHAKTQNKTLIIVGCRLCLPAELERELTVIEFSLPGKDQLGHVLNGICESAELKAVEGDEREKVLAAASGMTTIEAENAFALSVVQFKLVDPELVGKEKAQVVKKNGLLELIETSETLESVGGLDVLKEWLLKRKEAFSQRAVEYGLPTPKGLLILGVSGTGKSLTAKATAKVLGVPLLKLDAGRIFGGLVGQSEGNLRAVIQTAEASEAERPMYAQGIESQQDILAWGELIKDGLMDGEITLGPMGEPLCINRMMITVRGRLFLEELNQKEDAKTSIGLIKQNKFAIYKFVFSIVAGVVIGFFGKWLWEIWWPAK